jgi:hypothetical protein
MADGVLPVVGSETRGDPAVLDFVEGSGTDGVVVTAGRSQDGINSVPHAMQKGQDLRLV